MGRFNAEIETEKTFQIYETVALGGKIGECGAVVYEINKNITKVRALPDADVCYSCPLRNDCNLNQVKN